AVINSKNLADTLPRNLSVGDPPGDLLRPKSRLHPVDAVNLVKVRIRACPDQLAGNPSRDVKTPPGIDDDDTLPDFVAESVEHRLALQITIPSPPPLRPRLDVEDFSGTRAIANIPAGSGCDLRCPAGSLIEREAEIAAVVALDDV